MKCKDTKNLNTFEGTFSYIQLMKYPKIPAAIAHTFSEYESAESIIKHLFLYILKHYHSFSTSTFLEED